MAGITYPVRVQNGRLVIGDLTDKMKTISVLMTITGERPLNKDYGTNSYLFSSGVDLGVPTELIDGDLEVII